jgi:hypothetical protein
MVLPLLASCLALTLLAGTLLTMFTARRVVPPATQTTSEPPSPTPVVGEKDAKLPNSTVRVDGADTPLRTLKPAVLVLVPAGCRCARLARQLASRASRAKVGIYFAAATRRARAQARTLAQQAKGDKSTKKSTHLLTDQQGALASAYKPTGLTAILVYPDGSVSHIHWSVASAAKLSPEIQELRSTSPVGLDSPGSTTLAVNQAGLGAA